MQRKTGRKGLLACCTWQRREVDASSHVSHEASDSWLPSIKSIPKRYGALVNDRLKKKSPHIEFKSREIRKK